MSITPEQEQELLYKLRDSFQDVQSNSSRHGYQTRQVIDPDALFELLEKMIDKMAGR